MKIINIDNTLHLGIYCKHKGRYYFLQEISIKPSGDYSIFSHFYLNTQTFYQFHGTHHEANETQPSIFHLAKIRDKTLKDEEVLVEKLYPGYKQETIRLGEMDEHPLTRRHFQGYDSASIREGKKNLFACAPQEDYEVQGDQLKKREIIIDLDPTYSKKDVQVYGALLKRDNVADYLRAYPNKKLINHVEYPLDEIFLVCVKIITDL
ncbi:MAG: hypothetical protein ACQESG_07320 [Nanobdellota archaeon]